jgi:protein-tyrosine kinase
VADETSDKREKPHGGRTSLVERAAERLAGSRGGDGGRTIPPAAEVLSKSSAPPASSPAAETGEAAIEVVAPGPDPVEPLPPPKGARPEGGALDGRSNRRRRRTEVAEVDCAGLAARGLVTPDGKRNRTIEEFRLIKRVVLSRRWDIQGGPGNTVVVTSALPAEGKTTTAINLAMSIAAEEDVRVVLGDADFIKPDALRQLGVSASKGLIDVLQDPSMDIGDVLLRTDIDKLSLIPAGQLHERCTELLASARMDSLIKELSSRYEDRILIFDSPPILATTESVALTSHMGQVVFVVQAGRTKRESLNSALELIGERPHLGLILNRTASSFGTTEFGAYYSSYYYGYGANRDQAEQAAG